MHTLARRRLSAERSVPLALASREPHPPLDEVEVYPQQLDPAPKHPLLQRGEVAEGFKDVLDQLEVLLSS